MENTDLINQALSALHSTLGYANTQRFISYLQSDDFDRAYFERRMAEFEKLDRQHCEQTQRVDNTSCNQLQSVDPQS